MSKLIILIVDDDEVTLEIRSRQFAVLGEVRTAKNLREALEQMRRIPPPDLVVLDLIFVGPEAASAEDSLRHIKLLKDINQNTVVLVMTGVSESAMKEKAMASGADHFATKQDTATQERLFYACKEAFASGGQAVLDKLNQLLTTDFIHEVNGGLGQRRLRSD